ncbi:TIP41-like protein [Euroglyphus maynei]|uniref:TIP41-like protein n=1 Tax=Euroglyphus maynei TaxID=6958 RepID=A0A1Y3BC94_EURMA|nr:TIP41-like protein [Euroglyphus maynei]
MNAKPKQCPFSPGTLGLSADHRHYQQDEWLFETNRSHILNSKCTSSFVCDKTRAMMMGDECCDSTTNRKQQSTPRKSLDEYLDCKRRIYYERGLCQYCKYDLILSMAHLPDMTYASNHLRLVHKPSRLIIEFNALDALAPIVIKSYGLPVGLKVSASEAWLRARMNCEYTQNVCNADFDWTFSTDYGGTFRLDSLDKSSSPTEAIELRPDQPPLSQWIEPTDERIDMEQLKIHKQINFFDEIELFEDELADHGVAQCLVKIRVHPDCFYILCRFFLRVDRVFVRYFDTRLYHEFGSGYLLRERSQHESTIAELDLASDMAQALLTHPQELFGHVPIKNLVVDKIHLSSSSN